MPLDLTKIQGLHNGANGCQVGRCPACAENGRDHTNDHLIIYPDGRYGCIANQGDSEHRKRIWQLAGVGGDPDAMPEQNIQPPKPDIPQTFPISLLDKLIKDYSYWEGRGIPEEIMSKTRGGVALDGQMKNRWVIPIFGKNDVLVGFTGRALKAGMEPKWKHLGRTSMWVFGDREEIKKDKIAILVESPGDYLALKNAGIKNILCLFGVILQEKMIGFLIAANVKKIYISTNNDVKHTVGQDAAKRIKEKLDKFFEPDNVLVRLPTKKDFGEMSVEEINEWWSNVENNQN